MTDLETYLYKKVTELEEMSENAFLMAWNDFTLKYSVATDKNYEFVELMFLGWIIS